MDKNQDDKVFRYTYTGKNAEGLTHKECEEIKKIRSKYSEDKIDKLCRLDNEVSKKGNMVSVNIGVIGMLILGFAMCCGLVWDKLSVLPATLIGSLGVICMILAFPMKKHIIEKERVKIAPEILRLADEIINETKQEIPEN